MRRSIWAALTVVDPSDPGNRVALAQQDSDTLVMPRGFALRLRRGLAELGYEVEWMDERVDVTGESLPARLPDEFVLRPYQERMVKRIITAEQGTVVAPPAAGKSVVAAAVAMRTRQRTCVVVDKVNIATQWMERMAEVGVQASFVGDGMWDDTSDFVIALRQSLWSRRDELDRTRWWGRFGAVWADEQHQISAHSLREVIGRFPARIRGGLSATPDRHDWNWMLSRAVFGEIVVRVSPQEMEAEGVLVRPRVVVVKTGLSYRWNSRADPRREWHRLLRAIRDDPARNRLIGRVLAGQRGHCVLVQTDQLAHADEVAAQGLAHGWPRDSVVMLTGKTDRERRDEIRRRAETEDELLIVSTIGKEALDIPALSRYIIAWPARSQMNITQMIGRVRRTREGKGVPVVVDLSDGVGPCTEQFYSRRGVYEREQLQIVMLQADAQFDFDAMFSQLSQNDS